MSDVPTTDPPDDTQPDDDGGEDQEKEEEPAGATYEPCEHPLEHGTCWFSQIAEPCAQIAEPCATACKWAMDRGVSAGR